MTVLRSMVCLLLLATFASAQQESKVRDLQWMIGEWRAVEKSDGNETIVHMKVHEAENHQAILYDVWFEEKGQRTPQYTGMYYWSPQEKTYKVLQVDSKGTVGEGTYQQTGNRVVQLVKTASDHGSMELRSEWEIRPREFHFVAQFRPEGQTEWKPALEITYSRVPPL